MLEPILKEPGDIAFTWLEIHRTKNALLQQFDLQSNTTTTLTGGGSVAPGAAAGGSGSTGVTATTTTISGSSGGGAGAIGGGGSSTSSNDTLSDFGFYPKESDCEYKCPEIDACISAILWCDGKFSGKIFIFTAYFLFFFSSDLFFFGCSLLYIFL